METVENVAVEQPFRKDRSRKKQLYKAILTQMEFYFSDASLTKERIVSQRLYENGCVELSLFLGFNKIKALTSELKDLVKALKMSECLQVSEENMTVTRLTPVKKKENEDDHVIYVEQLPTDIDHDWLKEMFSRYGHIDYISLPKFKNGKLKGFGFVEFASTESVEAIVKDYKKAGCYLSTEMAPEELCSISANNQESKFENNKTSEQGKPTDSLKHKREPQEESIAEDETNNSVEGTLVKVKKMKKAENNIQKENKTIDLPENAKKKHIEDNNASEEELGMTHKNEKGTKENEEMNGDTERKHKKKKIKHDCTGETNTDNTLDASEQPEQKSEGNSDKGNEMTEEVKKKKNRKKKKKPKKLKITAESSGLLILSKVDWKRLRNKYLNTQKDKMKLLKKHLSQNQFRSDKQSVNQNEANSSSIPIEFTSGLIVKANLSEPVIEVKRFKEEAKSNSNVKYIDVKEGSTQIYFRFDTAEDAKKFTNSTEWSNVEIIEGEEETQYWQKIHTDRAEKLQKSKKSKERGKTKLVKKAEKALGKRIVFEGLDNE